MTAPETPVEVRERTHATLADEDDETDVAKAFRFAALKVRGKIPTPF